jgi:ketosteroid isomerase-like protein
VSIRGGYVLWIGVAIAVLSGCGLAGGRPTDVEQVAATVERWRAAMVAGDTDRLMDTYSEEFGCFDAPSKEAMKSYMRGLLEQGVFQDIEVFVDTAESTREGEVIRVFPVELLLANGYLTVFRLTLRREDGGWLIVDQEW